MIGWTLCSGIGAPEVAAPWVDWRLASEIEQFPRAVLQERFGYRKPSDHNQGDPLLWGDMTEVTPELARARGVPLPDLLVAGTPCQAFSIAGLRGGVSDERGNLTLKFVEICHAIVDARPDGKLAVLWENVPGILSDKENAFGCFLAGLVGGVDALPPPGDGSWPGEGMVEGPRARAAWAVLDAQWFGVAQRRRRVFVVVDFGNCVDPAAVLLEPDRLRGDTPPRREAGKDVAPTISARPTGGGGLGTDFDLDGGLIASTGSVPHCLNAGGMGRIDYETETMVAHALRGEGFDAKRCKADGCDRQAHAKGFCKPHYSRWKRHGDPLAGRVAEGGPLAFLEIQCASETDACIPWPYALFKSGYPSIYIKGANLRAHRVMCEWVNGLPPSADLDAAHSCGNRSCVNPRHLRWASRAENMADAINHGTTTRGERHGGSKLTSDDVQLIFSRLDDGETHQGIADSFGVSRNTITDIAKGKNWSWLREDGTGRGTPIVPVAFSSKDHGADAETDLSPTLRAGGHAGSHANAGVPPAIAIQERAVSTNPASGPQGAVSRADDTAFTLEARNKVQAVAFAQNTRDEVRLLNGDGQISAARSAETGAKQQTYLAFDLRGRDDGAQVESVGQTVSLRAADGGSSRSYVADAWAVRRLMPVECARLQGFPDDHTAITYRGKPAADGPQYKALGNSMAVPCIKWVMDRMRASMEACA